MWAIRIRLSDENIDEVYRVYMDRAEVEHFSSLVSNDDIIANDANLSVSSYVEQKDTREEVDIVALNAEIARIVARQSEVCAPKLTPSWQIWRDRNDSKPRSSYRSCCFCG